MNSDGDMVFACVFVAIITAVLFFVVGSLTSRGSAHTYNETASVIQVLKDNQLNGPETIFQAKDGLYYTHVIDRNLVIGTQVNIKTSSNGSITAITFTDGKFVCMDWC